MTTRNNAENTRGRPFTIGNSGKPPKALNKATIAVQALLKAITSFFFPARFIPHRVTIFSARPGQRGIMRFILPSPFR